MQPALATRSDPSPGDADETRLDAVDPRRLARLSWRCRRGMLENDLILERFLAVRGGTLTAAEIAALDRLLDHSDNDLWDILCGRLDPGEASLLPLLKCLRST